MIFRRFAALLLPSLALCVAACDDAPTDAGVDAGVDAGPVCPENLPPPSDPCLAGQCGNEFFVGQPCTPGGGECSDLGAGNAIFCTADFDAETTLHFCTKPCVNDEQCGAGARCAIDPEDPGAGAGCFLTRCDAPDDGGTQTSDAGPGDAGPGDAGPGDAGADAGPGEAGADAGPPADGGR